MDTTSEGLPRKDFLSRSAPIFALFSEKGESVDIDVNTGLPVLPVELPPEEPFEEVLQLGPRKSVTFDFQGQETQQPSPTNMNKSPKTSTTRPAPMKYSPLIHKKLPGEVQQSTIESSQSVDEGAAPVPIRRGNRGRHTLPLKNRSRSVFIRLQLPNARTPPLPHRNLSILGESDSSDTDVQTAPVVDSQSKPYFHYNESGRRASDGSALADKKKNMDLSEISTVLDEPVQILSDTPSTAGFNASLGRRGSYLYLSDDEDEQVVTRSRASSTSSHIGDETYVTPFAQILANLHRVRSQFLNLLSLPPETRTTFTRTNNIPSPSGPPRKLPEAAQKKLAMQTLEEFDWCLKKLESVNSASMGTMAQDKFRRMLSRELSHMSGKSKSGTHVAEWVQDITNLDLGSSIVDRALDTMTANQDDDEQEIDKLYLQEGRLSGSLSHDVWSKLRSRKSKTTHQAAAEPSTDYCVRVPMFGVTDPKMNKPAMREFMVNQLDVWDVDTFYLDSISAGNSLLSASYLIFKKRDLFTSFKISPIAFINFMSKIQSAYLPNPYHNKVHATDVLIATNYLLKAEALNGVFSDLEILAALTAACIHDVGHFARTNQFLVNVQHELALLYNDNSVLENHHLAMAFKALQDPQCNILVNFDPDQRQAFRRMVIDMVLATDMAKHFKHLGELKTLLETHKVANDGILVLDKYSERSEVLQCMIHCADLSNPAKREDLAADWSRRIMEENFLQGDEEKSLSIPLNPLGDREQVSLCKCQVTFIDFIVYPLWETWAELVYPDGKLMLDNIAKTREYWKAQIDPNSSPPPSDQESEQGSEEGSLSDRTDNFVANGPTKNCSSGDKRREDGSVACEGSPSGRVACCGLISTGSDEQSGLSDDVHKSYVESPVSERRHSFKAMKNFKALEDSMS